MTKLSERILAKEPPKPQQHESYLDGVQDGLREAFYISARLAREAESGPIVIELDGGGNRDYPQFSDDARFFVWAFDASDVIWFDRRKPEAIDRNGNKITLEYALGDWVGNEWIELKQPKALTAELDQLRQRAERAEAELDAIAKVVMGRTENVNDLPGVIDECLKERWQAMQQVAELRELLEDTAGNGEYWRARIAAALGPTE